MPNLRIVFDNAADRATLTASSQAGALGPANLQTEEMSEILRSVGTALTITAEWTNQEIVGLVAPLYSNLSATAMLRVRGYALAADTVPISDVTGLACAYAPLGLFDWGVLPLGVNAFAYGGAVHARMWFAPTVVRKLVIDIVDVNNLAGYIEVGRLVAGNYWSPRYNAGYGASASQADTSTQYRTAAGRQKVDRGTRFTKLAFELSTLTSSDRAAFWLILRRCGLSRPMFVSLFPESRDPALEQAHQIYGRLSALAAVSIPNYERYASSVDFEEI